MKKSNYVTFVAAAVLLVCACQAPSMSAVVVKDSGWLQDKDENEDSRGDAGKIYWMEKGSKSYRARNVFVDTGKMQFTLKYESCDDPAHLKGGQKQHITGPQSGLGMWSRNGSGWYGNGFVDMLIDGAGLADYKPEISVDSRGEEASAAYVWETPNGKVTMKFTVRAGDDKIALKIDVQPKADVKSIQTSFLCYPSSFALGEQAKLGRDRYITTPKRTVQHGSTVTLDKDEFWVLYSDKIWDKAEQKDCGGPCAILFPPSELESAQVKVNNYECASTFTYPVSARTMNYVLWPAMGITNEEALTAMKGVKLK